MAITFVIRVVYWLHKIVDRANMTLTTGFWKATLNFKVGGTSRRQCSTPPNSQLIKNGQRGGARVELKQGPLNMSNDLEATKPSKANKLCSHKEKRILPHARLTAGLFATNSQTTLYISSKMASNKWIWGCMLFGFSKVTRKSNNSWRTLVDFCTCNSLHLKGNPVWIPEV